MTCKGNSLQFFKVFSCFKLIVISFLFLPAHMQGLTSKCSSLLLYLLFHLFPQVVIWPVRLHVCFNKHPGGGVTCKGSTPPWVFLFSYFHTFFTFIIRSWGKGLCLQGQQFPFLACLFFSAAFPLGGASIILENRDAFGVFECPHLYWARIVFNWDPCKLFMISKHVLLKRQWAFVHSDLIPPLVCSCWGPANKLQDMQH